MNCPSRETLLGSVEDGSLSGMVAGMTSHLAGCDSCQEIVAGAWMGAVAEKSAPTHILPGASQIWLRSQLFRQQEAEEKAIRPLRILQTSLFVFAAAGPAAWLTWKWPQFAAFIHNLDSMPDVIPSLTLSSIPMAVIIVFGGFAAMAAVLGVQMLLAEE